MEGRKASSDLVDQLSAVGVLQREHGGPEVRVLSPHKVTCLALEQGVLIAHLRREGEGGRGRGRGRERWLRMRQC